MMYSYALTDSHLDKLLELVTLIKQDKNFAAWVKKGFFLYAKRVANLDKNQTKKFSQQIWKLFDGNKLRDAEFNALFYDYVMSLDASSKLHKPDLLDKFNGRLSQLKIDVTSRISEFENPFVNLAATIDTREIENVIPGQFFGEYVGYRRSTNSEDIIRFYFNIQRPENQETGFVRYLNLYKRGGVRWVVNGGGIYCQENTLYLFGHARSETGDESLGYRTQALRLIPTTSFVCGPVISRDLDGPIAARILLIPLRAHRLTQPQIKLSSKELLNYLIEPPEETGSGNFIKEIEDNVGYLFGHRKLDGLLQYISNITPTALSWIPDFTDVNTQRLLNADVSLRTFSHHSEGRNYPDELAAALENHLAELTKLENARA